MESPETIATALARHGITLPPADLAFLAAQAAMLERTLAAIRQATPRDRPA